MVDCDDSDGDPVAMQSLRADSMSESLLALRKEQAVGALAVRADASRDFHAAMLGVEGWAITAQRGWMKSWTCYEPEDIYN